MASAQATIDYLIDQLSSSNGLGQVTFRKMFGEYALYSNGKVFAFVCDDQLFLKPTEAGKAFLKHPEEKPAYPGSKMYFWISGEKWDDADWLTQLVMTSLKELPEPKPKKSKKRGV